MEDAYADRGGVVISGNVTHGPNNAVFQGMCKCKFLLRTANPQFTINDKEISIIARRKSYSCTDESRTAISILYSQTYAYSSIRVYSDRS